MAFHLRALVLIVQTNPLERITFFFLVAIMSSNLPIAHGDITAPTPQNTPLNQAPIAQGLSRPTVPDISEDNEQEDDGDDALPPGAQSAMLGLVQNRLSDLVGKSSGYIEGLSNEVKQSIEALKGVQVKQNELQNQYKRECLELEKKVRHRPLFISLCMRHRVAHSPRLVSLVPRTSKAAL